MDRHAQQLTLGLFFLAAATLEAVIGTAVGANHIRGFYRIRRNKNARSFWFTVTLTALLGVIGIGLGVFS